MAISLDAWQKSLVDVPRTHSANDVLINYVLPLFDLSDENLICVYSCISFGDQSVASVF